jgi:hypothetical protein
MEVQQCATRPMMTLMTIFSIQFRRVRLLGHQGVYRNVPKSFSISMDILDRTTNADRLELLFHAVFLDIIQ